MGHVYLITFFKWKLINLNLKLIGFPACYTRVAFMKSALHKKPECWTSEAGFLNNNNMFVYMLLLLSILLMCTSERELRRVKEE